MILSDLLKFTQEVVKLGFKLIYLSTNIDLESACKKH